MDQIRDRVLDNLCEAIGDTRATANAARQEEAGYLSSALKRMTGREASIYKHAGVELALVPGSDKLRVRLIDQQGDAEVHGRKGKRPAREEPGDDEALEPLDTVGDEGGGDDSQDLSVQ